MKKLVIPSKLSEVPKVHDAVMSQVQARGFSVDAMFAIRLALDEALANAIRHGNHCDPLKKVTIEYEVTTDLARIRIQDQGCGFNPQSVSDPTLDENLEKPYGRGIMLMKAYMTQVRFNEQGNCVTLEKSRTCSLPNPHPNNRRRR